MKRSTVAPDVTFAPIPSVPALQFATLHAQLTEIRQAFTTAARGTDSITADQVAQLVAQQGAAAGPLGLALQWQQCHARAGDAVASRV
jgi:hypothetical protein